MLTEIQWLNASSFECKKKEVLSNVAREEFVDFRNFKKKSKQRMFG